MLTKKIEHCINISELLIRTTPDIFTVDATYWCKKSDATDLRIQIINFLREATGRSKLEGMRVGRKTLQKRKLANQLS